MRGVLFHGQKGIFKLGSRNGPGKIVALNGIAFRLFCKSVLRLGFYALGNHGNIQSVRHGDYDAGYGLACLVAY